MFHSTNIQLLIYIFFCVISIEKCIAQINFTQSNDIVVIKNGIQLKNPWAGGMNFCQFSPIDLNLDGQDDLFIFDKSGKNGTKNGNKKLPFIYNQVTGYTYAPEYIDAFPKLSDWALLVDYNQDGKNDIFSSYESSIVVYTNNSNSYLQFDSTKIISSDAGFGPINLYVSNSDLPAIVDVDGDGDIDILSFDPSGSHVYFHENKSMQLYGTPDSIELVRSDNCWGRFKEDFSTNSVTLNLNEDCDEISDEGRSARHSGSTLLAIDLDSINNQGLELLLGDITYDNMVMLYNGGTNEEALMTNQDLNFPSYNQSVNITRFPGAFHLDVDDDNLKDLIISPNGVNVSENHKNCLFYKNTGNDTNNYLEFNFIENDFLIKEMIDVGSNANPLLYDLNNDNLLDLIISNKGYFENGNYNSSIALYQNIGSLTNPVFEFVTEDFSNISTLLGNLPSIQALHPTFGDLNGDGFIDMVIGDNNGDLYYFENDGNTETFLEWPSYSSYEMLNIDVGSFATPQLIDLNRDGLLDLIIGERMGIDNGTYNGINYYQNTGSSEIANFENYTPEFPSGDFDENGNEITTKSLGGIHIANPIYLTGYTNPYVFEYNGTYHLAVGSEEGLIYLYNEVEMINIETNDTVLNLTTPFNEITNNMLNTRNCVHAKAAIFDINNDNLIDVIRGNASGGLELFFGDNINTTFNNSTIIDEIKIFPNPNDGIVHIELPYNLNVKLNIYSSIGQLVYTKTISETQNKISLSHLHEGVYIVNIESENHQQTSKLIIRK